MAPNLSTPFLPEFDPDLPTLAASGKANFVAQTSRLLTLPLVVLQCIIQHLGFDTWIMLVRGGLRGAMAAMDMDPFANARDSGILTSCKLLRSEALRVVLAQSTFLILLNERNRDYYASKLNLLHRITNFEFSVGKDIIDDVAVLQIRQMVAKGIFPASRNTQDRTPLADFAFLLARHIGARPIRGGQCTIGIPETECQSLHNSEVLCEKFLVHFGAFAEVQIQINGKDCPMPINHGYLRIAHSGCTVYYLSEKNPLCKEPGIVHAPQNLIGADLEDFEEQDEDEPRPHTERGFTTLRSTPKGLATLINKHLRPLYGPPFHIYATKSPDQTVEIAEDMLVAILTIHQHRIYFWPQKKSVDGARLVKRIQAQGKCKCLGE